MIRINYTFKTVGPLFTGSDENSGTLRTLRRQKIALAENQVYQTRLDEKTRRDAVVQILAGVWQAIDFDSIKGQRLMGIWGEFANKLTAAARAANKFQFFENLCRSWGIEAITNKQVLTALNLLTDQELLDTVRNESKYLVLSLRVLRDEAKAKKADNNNDLLFDLEPVKPSNEAITVVKTEDFIPCISGNSFRGRLRRLAMIDFCRRVGIQRLDKKVYHTLFTGGFLDQSTQYEDFDRLEEFVKACPMLGVLGSAIGNMTIEGEMLVGWAYPLCRERGTGDQSFWQFLDTVFQTRHDSSKTESDLELTGEDKEGAQQMKYEYEVFAPGTPFEHRIACTSDKELIVSAFEHLIDLFKASPYIGGQGSVGNGELDLSELKIENGVTSNVYTKYLDENQVKIHEFWAGLKM
ncbi:MAG TPA: hypothetical protein PKH75_12960 [Bacillota bacterium]|nr:hypothetical protein [Bacillota bacterium]